MFLGNGTAEVEQPTRAESGRRGDGLGRPLLAGTTGTRPASTLLTMRRELDGVCASAADWDGAPQLPLACTRQLLSMSAEVYRLDASPTLGAVDTVRGPISGAPCLAGPSSTGMLSRRECAASSYGDILLNHTLQTLLAVLKH